MAALRLAPGLAAPVPEPEPPNSPENNELRPPVRLVVTGFSAALTLSADRRSASVLSVSSKLLPLTMLCVNAAFIARAKPFALVVSRPVLAVSLSVSATGSLSWSSSLSAIGKPRDQFVERRAHERRRGGRAEHRLRGEREFARRHRPERSGRKLG